MSYLPRTRIRPLLAGSMHVSLILPDGANIAMEESGNVVDDASIGKNFDDPLLLDVPQILFLALCNDLILLLGIQDIP